MNTGKELKKAEGGDGAERRHAGRLSGGHGGYPFQKRLDRAAFPPDDSQIIAQPTLRNAQPDMPALHPLHGFVSRFRHDSVGVAQSGRFRPATCRNRAAMPPASVAERTLADVPFSC